ncbi:hypothetical protein NPIL_346511 [Nephila pilipes]|uniref:Uncharacterized protein n=1 Tax=Nephila pilipes TaxID=299642 RepID=A0A8X6MZI3_NEPPI|nr:hypothetical protein NPIL_346511 [Nephila pilipes]
MSFGIAICTDGPPDMTVSITGFIAHNWKQCWNNVVQASDVSDVKMSAHVQFQFVARPLLHSIYNSPESPKRSLYALRSQKISVQQRHSNFSSPEEKAFIEENGCEITQSSGQPGQQFSDPMRRL